MARFVAKDNPARAFEIPLEGAAIIGRGEGCAIRILKQDISRQHARIERIGGAYYLLDLQSRNGTRVNGKILLGRQRLNDGDVVAFGKTEFLFCEEIVDQAVAAEEGVPEASPAPPSNVAREIALPIQLPSVPLPTICIALAVLAYVAVLISRGFAITVSVVALGTAVVSWIDARVKKDDNGARRSVGALIAVGLLLGSFFIARAVIPGLRRYRIEHTKLLCRRNLETISLAIQRYQIDHEGRRPETLEDLVGTYLKKDDLICPFFKQRNPDYGKMEPTYVYLNAELPTNAPADAILAYCGSLQAHNNEGTNVLYVDGRVGWLSIGKFRKKLAEQRERFGYGPSLSPGQPSPNSPKE